MKQYLIDTFKYNDFANKELIKKIKELPDPDNSIRFFCHLINSQYKWMARIKQNPNAKTMSWWDPMYTLYQLEEEWSKSVKLWINYLESKTDEEIGSVVEFFGFDGGRWEAKIQDIALQLNYHSIHHRAQIQTLIRQQGLEPDFLDYIGTKYRKIS